MPVLSRANFAGSNDTAEIKVHPSGKFLFCLQSRTRHDCPLLHRRQNWCSNSGRSLFPKATPRNFEIDPTGKFLFVANEDTNNIAAFQIDSSNGRLTFMKHVQQSDFLSNFFAMS